MGQKILIDLDTLWTLRNAAFEWLMNPANATNLNKPDVIKARDNVERIIKEALPQ